MTTITLLLAAAGVFATFVAPRLGPRARLCCEVIGASRIGSPQGVGGLTVEVKHLGQLLEAPVFSVQATVENTGSRDITKAEFVDPISIKMIDGVSLISGEVSAPEGVKPVLSIERGEASLTWSILKPGEKIAISTIVQSTGDVPDRAKIIAILPRLRDVKVSPKADVGKYFHVATYAVLPILIAAAMLLSPSIWQTRDRLYVRRDGLEYQVYIGDNIDGYAELCPAGSLLNNKCIDLKFGDVLPILRGSYLKEKSPFSQLQIWAVLTSALSMLVTAGFMLYTYGNRRRESVSDA